MSFNRKIIGLDKMMRINVEQAAAQLYQLLEQVACGEEVILVKQDQEVARLVPPLSREQYLNRTKQFRASLQTQGEGLSTTVIRARQEEHS